MTLPALRSGSPLAAFRSMFDDFFNEPFFSSNRDVSTQMWPRMDIMEEKERFIVKADLPGLKKEDITISIEGDTLYISGEKKEEKRKEEGLYCHLERTYGSFQRSFTLPENIDRDKVDARYNNGILELSLIKSGEPKRKGIQVEVKS